MRRNTLISLVVRIGEKLERVVSRFRWFWYSLLLQAPGCRIGARARVRGHEAIRIGRGFVSLEYLWLDAVRWYRGKSYNPSVAIGDRVIVGLGVHIGAIDRITIGDDTLIGSRVTIIDHNHGDYGENSDHCLTPPTSRPLHSPGPIEIGSNVWIGDGVCVLGGVSIGPGSVIGANSVVTSNIPAGSLAVGSPCRVLRSFDEHTRQWSVLRKIEEANS